ncbi:hypothetical protein MMC26_005520 [Xylographa opegraphella]|nr:hypothetical protein [Xylographa opegraphella]
MLGRTSGDSRPALSASYASSTSERRPKQQPPIVSAHSYRSARASSATVSVDISAASNAAADGGDSLRNISWESERNCGGLNAEKWFDDSNKNVCRNRNVSFEDRTYIPLPRFEFKASDVPTIGDPPFYLRNRTSAAEDTSGAVQSKTRDNDTLQASEQPLLSRMDSFGSTSEEYRGVIDDLTVENQILKQRLKAYERHYSSHLQREKLFEVRIHGLPLSKKRKLEETLRDFVANLEKPAIDQPQALQQPPLQHLPLSKGPKVSSSTTSNTHPPDSGYASMSTPRNASIPQSSHLETLKPSQPVLSNRQNIKSYLQDIPRGLLPKRPRQMTERSRKKLVVKRLEELFTGKGAASELSSQSMQQEEVSQLAARADRRAVEASGHAASIEGHREAKMLYHDTKDLVDTMGTDLPAVRQRSLSNCGESATGGMNCSSSANSDQRPTRPIDLDPCRAQIPSENIDYIRHLCLATPDLDLDPSPGDGNRWVYLNLLFGMAQLHMLNVTPGFVRTAVAGVSEKFDLSSDGSKIRWRGGREGTNMSSDGNSSVEQENESSMDDLQAASKSRGRSSQSRSEEQRGLSKSPRSGFDALLPASGLAKVEVPVSAYRARRGRNLNYQPLFRHQTKSYDGDHAMTEHDSQHSSTHIQDNVACAAIYRPTLEDGPIIFYDRVGFCTDFSREASRVPYNVPEYDKPTCSVLGCPADDCPNSTGRFTESKGPLDMYTCDVNNDWSEQDQFENMELLEIDARSTASVDNVYTESAAVKLEASGIGGVRPSDNFVVEVNIRHVCTPTQHPQAASYVSGKSCVWTRHHLDMKTRRALQNRRHLSAYRVQNEIVSAVRTVLSPSSLPPPSYAFIPFSSSNSEDCDDESVSAFNNSRRSSSMSLVKAEVFAPPRHLYSVSSESTRQGTDSSSDDSSIDMLAHARQFDPDSVAAQEREFDTNRILSILEDTPVATARTHSGSASSSGEDDSTATSDVDDLTLPSILKRQRDVDLQLDDNVKRLRVH